MKDCADTRSLNDLVWLRTKGNKEVMPTDFFCFTTPLTLVLFARPRCVLVSGSVGPKLFSNAACAATPKWDPQVALRGRLPRGLGPAHPAIVAVLRGVRGERRSSEAILEFKKALARRCEVRLNSGAFNGLSRLFSRSRSLFSSLYLFFLSKGSWLLDL